MRELTRQFRDLKRQVDLIIPAWSGPSPSWRFTRGVSLFTVQQVLVISGDRASLITCWTGWPTVVKATGRMVDVGVVKHGRRYDRMSLDGRRFWIAAESRDVLTQYLALGLRRSSWPGFVRGDRDRRAFRPGFFPQVNGA
jgi:hypothetical protein